MTHPSGVTRSSYDEKICAGTVCGTEAFMRDLHIGDRVTFLGRAYYVRGFSPFSIAPPMIYLEDAQTGGQLELPVDDLAAALKSSSGESDTSGE
jgi:hypothetical protein